jgi:hypothetical protein
MKLDDETLMLLNICANAKTELIEDDIKSAIVNCFSVMDYLRHKPNNKLLLFFEQTFGEVAKSVAQKALDKAPENIREEVEPLWEIQRKFEEILLTLGGQSYRDHLNHSKRDFWLGILLSRIKNNWGLKNREFGNFENSWYLAARFHDFCYILQNIKEIVEDTEDTIHGAFQSMNFSMKIDIILGGTFVTQKHLKLLDYLSTGKDVDSFLTNISFLEQLEGKSHSILSALFIIDFLRTNNMIPRGFSEEDLQQIARAVALHTDSFTQAGLQPQRDYLAALMILVDEIQEWGRPTYKKEDLIIKEIELNNLTVCFKKIPKIQSLINKMLYGSGIHKLPKLRFEIPEQFVNSIAVERRGDDIEILFLVKIKNSETFSKEIGKMQKEEKKQLMLEHARARAETVISELSLFANSIGFKAIQLEPDDIIFSTDEKSIALEIPLLKKYKHFPIAADRNLLSVVLAFTFSRLSPFEPKNVPQLVFEGASNKVIEFNIRNLKRKDILKKKRNLFRLNVFKWDWGIRIVSKPNYDGREEHVFPTKTLKEDD